ncbi:MAG: GumN family protein, partial [Caulobacter sp.]|nr:GumN family protein [Caulobacter sp.]
MGSIPGVQQMKRAMIALLVAGIFILPAHAQAPVPLDDPEATTVDEFVVRARLPGPAWWTVSDGDSKVYILGIPDALPRGQTWDQSLLKKRLKGANGLITPPVVQASANPLAFPGLLARWNAAGKSGGDLQKTLPAGDWARLQRAAAAAGQAPDRYRGLKPWFAGLKLSGDYQKRAGLDYSQPLKAVRAAARQAKIKATPAHVESTKVARMLDQLDRLPPTAGPLCLSTALGEVEAGAGSVRRAGQAWASGDVSGTLAAPRSAARCWAALPGVGRLT